MSFHESRERVPTSTKPINRILVATDGGSSSQHAVALGVELAAAEHAQVTFLHVVPPVQYMAGRLSMPTVPRRLRSIGDEVLDDAAFIADDRGVRFERDLIAGDTGGSILALADTIDADLIVVGERPRRLRVGSNVSHWVARRSTRPVLIARAPVGERLAA